MTEENISDISCTKVVKDFYLMFKEKINWLCDPEGPSFSKYIIYNISFTFIGLLFLLFDLILVSSFYSNLGFVNEIVEDYSVDFVLYLISILLFLGGTLFVIGRYPRQEELSTGAYNEEIDNLIS